MAMRPGVIQEMDADRILSDLGMAVQVRLLNNHSGFGIQDRGECAARASRFIDLNMPGMRETICSACKYGECLAELLGDHLGDIEVGRLIADYLEISGVNSFCGCHSCQVNSTGKSPFCGLA
jgi:hypothetical protein